MKIPYSVPMIDVIQDSNVLFKITSTQEFDEDQDRVYLKCAEHVKDFKRGFTCDMQINYPVRDTAGNSEEKYGSIEDLVLVYINKRFDISEFPQFEYVFFK